MNVIFRKQRFLAIFALRKFLNTTNYTKMAKKLNDIHFQFSINSIFIKLKQILPI